MPALTEYLPTLPSVRRWLVGLRETLADGCSVIVVLPTSLDVTGIWDALRLEIERIRGEWPAEVDLAEIPRGGDALTAFAAAFGVEARGGVALESCLTTPGLPRVWSCPGFVDSREDSHRGGLDHPPKWLLHRRPARPGQAGR